MLGPLLHSEILLLAAPFFVASAIGALLVAYGLAHRTSRGATELILSALLASFWSLLGGLELLQTDLDSLIFLSSLKYIGYNFAPLCWLFLVFRLEGNLKALRLPVLGLLALVPILVTAGFLWEPVSRLFRYSFQLETIGPLVNLRFRMGPLYAVFFAYDWGILCMAVGLLLAGADRTGSYFRRQAGLFSLAFGPFFLVLLAYTMGFSPLPRHDLSPVVWVGSIGLLWWGVRRRRLFLIPSISRSTVFEHSPDGTLVVDRDWNLVDSNASARSLLGLEEPSAGLCLREVLPALASVTAPQLSGAARRELVLRIRTTGGFRFVELNVLPLEKPGGDEVWVLLARDVTDLKWMREQVLRQREELLVASEHARISKSLHDTLGQVLSFAVIQSVTVRTELDNGNSSLAAQHLDRLAEVLREANEDLRSVVRGLGEAEIKFLSLKRLLEREVTRLQANRPHQVTLIVKPEDADFVPFEKDQLVHLAREALSNVLKHAKASAVTVHFREFGDHNCLTIEDDGIGLRAGDGASGSGRIIMAERASYLGGSVSFGERPEGGTRVEVTWPVRGRALP